MKSRCGKNSFRETRYVGEVGIDAGPRYYRSIELQKQIFEHVLKACDRAGAKF